jgi:hypothetical protein
MYDDIMDEALLLLLAVIANGIFDAVVVAYLAGRRSKTALLKAIAEPDEETQAAIESLIENLLNTLDRPSIKVVVGTDEQGKEKVEWISPIDSLISRIGSTIFNRIRGLYGSVKQGENRMTADLAGLAGISMPRKGQSTSEYLLQQIGERLIPIIEKKAEEIISKQKSNVNAWDAPR